MWAKLSFDQKGPLLICNSSVDWYYFVHRNLIQPMLFQTLHNSLFLFPKPFIEIKPSVTITGSRIKLKVQLPF